MGFFDTIKGLGRAITGGGAKVQVNIAPATTKAPFRVSVQVQVADADIEVKNVYLLLRSQEEVRIDKKGLMRAVSANVRDALSDGRLDGVVLREKTSDFRVNISGQATLKANQEYSFEAEVSLPADARPSYKGVKCDHVWSLQAGLDAFGNDPDSGWVEFQVS